MIRITSDLETRATEIGFEEYKGSPFRVVSTTRIITRKRRIWNQSQVLHVNGDVLDAGKAARESGQNTPMPLERTTIATEEIRISQNPWHFMKDGKLCTD